MSQFLPPLAVVLLLSLYSPGRVSADADAGSPNVSAGVDAPGSDAVDAETAAAEGGEAEQPEGEPEQASGPDSALDSSSAGAAAAASAPSGGSQGAEEGAEDSASDEPPVAPEESGGPKGVATGSGAAAERAPEAPDASGLRAFVGRLSRNAAEPCFVRDVRVRGSSGYVACGTAGVWECVYDGPSQRWKRSKVIRVPGAAVGLWERGGEVGVDVAATRSAPLRAFAGQAAAGAGSTSGPPLDPFECAAPRVSVQEAGVRAFWFDVPRSHCLRWREHVALLDGAGRTLAVGLVRRRRGRAVKVTLGYHEQVDPAEVVVLKASARALTSPMVAPRRGGDMWILRALVQGLVGGVGPSGGLLGEASLEYAFERPAFLRAEVAPFGVASGPADDFGDNDGEPATSFAAVLIGGVDARFASVGIGLGLSTVNDATDDQFNALPAGTGTTIPFYLRLGARDGLHVGARGDMTVFRSELWFTMVSAQLNIPVNHRSALQLRGRGGPAGVIAGEILTRMLLRGDGGPGSWFVEFGLGGGSVFEHRCERGTSPAFTGCFVTGTNTYNGLTLNAGLEKRF